MNTVLEHVNAFWAAYGGWLTTALIPTIIAGLTISPKTEKAAGTVPKIWDLVKQVMGFLSLVTHKDQPGTFQMPLKLGKVAKKLKKSKHVPPAAMLLVILTFSQTNCAWWSKHGGKVEDVAVNCGTVAVKDAAMNLLPAVLAILSGGAISWNEQLNAFAKQFGQDSVACALEFASNKLMAEHPAGAGSGSGDGGMEGVNKARSYMADHHLTVKE